MLHDYKYFISNKFKFKNIIYKACIKLLLEVRTIQESI